MRLSLAEKFARFEARCSECEDIWPCPKCGLERTAEGHDPRIANLPGVKHACCGHGHSFGYVMFNDGRLIRGMFESEDEVSVVRDPKTGKILPGFRVLSVKEMEGKTIVRCGPAEGG